MSTRDYRVRNWGDYNKALVERGSITFWFNEDIIKGWYEPEHTSNGRGRPRRYSHLAIEICSTLRALYGLPYRSCQGFVSSLFAIMKLPVKTPSYSQICRRQKTLLLKLRHRVKGRIHVVVDATGLKIFGEGEWKVRQHGYSKRRMWRKLHIGIDVASQEIVMMKLTDNHIGENKLLGELLDEYEDGYVRVGGDKGYDSYACHEEVGSRGAQSSILPQKKSKIRNRLDGKSQVLVRDNITRRIRKVGRKKWKEEVSYHKRSLVETAMYRYKTIFGGKMQSHKLENQQIEAMIKCNILNQFTRLGMPDSYAI